MGIKEQAQRAWREDFGQKQDRINRKRGILGNGSGIVRDPERPDVVYIRINGDPANVWKVFNDTVADTDGLPVIIEEQSDSRVWRVVEVDRGVISQVGSGWLGEKFDKTHANEHEWPDRAPGRQPVNIFSRALVPLRTEPTTPSYSLNINIRPYVYTYEGVIKQYLGETLPIDTYIPGSGIRYAVSYVDIRVNAAYVIGGAPVAYEANAQPPLPMMPWFAKPSAILTLRQGQGIVTEADIISVADIHDTSGVKHNLQAQRAPTTSDDYSQSYSAGSIWIDRDTPAVYVCVTPGLGSADWNQIDGSGSSSSLNPNLLINGAADIWQAGTSFTAATTPANNDDTYLLDQWLLLSDGNDIVDVSQQSSSPPSGARYFTRCTVQTANKQFGWLFPLEAADSIPMRGEDVSLSIQAKTTGAAIDNIRMAVLEWANTADFITSDVVSAWAGSGSNPTLATDWSYASTPTNLALTTAWQTFSEAGITLGSTLNNLAVFVWVDDTTIDASDILDLTMVKLEIGTTVTDYEPISHSRIISELAACQAYRYDTRDSSDNAHGGPAISTNTIITAIEFPTKMRVKPTFAIYNNTTQNEIYHVNGATGVSASPSLVERNPFGVTEIRVSGATLTVGDGYHFNIVCTAPL